MRHLKTIGFALLLGFSQFTLADQVKDIMVAYNTALEKADSDTDQRQAISEALRSLLALKHSPRHLAQKSEGEFNGIVDNWKGTLLGGLVLSGNWKAGTHNWLNGN